MSEGSVSDKSSTPSPNLELENDVKKHPLENQWTLWYYGKSHHESETDWKGNLKEVNFANNCEKNRECATHLYFLLLTNFLPRQIAGKNVLKKKNVKKQRFLHYLTDNNFDFTDFADFTKKNISDHYHFYC